MHHTTRQPRPARRLTAADLDRLITARRLPDVATPRTAWAKTDHGALLDGTGDTSHLASHITRVGIVHNDGTHTQLPTSTPRRPIELEVEHEPWHLPHMNAKAHAQIRAAGGSRNTTGTHAGTHANTVSARPGAGLGTGAPAPRSPRPMRRAADWRHPREIDAEPITLRWWLAGAAVAVATAAASSLWPWGTALPL